MDITRLQAEEHLNYCRGCIRVYTRTAETLQRRIAEANASTSAKNDIVSAEINTSNEPETRENKTSSTEKSAKNDAVSEEPSTTKEAETEENKSSGTQKGVEVPEAETKDDETEENKSLGTQKGVEVPEAETKDDDAKSNDENVDDEEVEIDGKIIDDSVKAACNVGMTLTQVTILKFPEFFEASNAGFNTNDSENPASNVVKDVTDGEKPTECVSNVVTEYESSNVIIVL
ncbi:hypothetical protein MtrunA17_Chr6g0471841 [Medicago truncatula]|uniref:Uncharacterized protein n=1 Tax=Medicago truncatula TaxID=3880 RepID=A0A396HLD1_MEDTR|nr:hypothetical protein MtrunA17_Chr6g0471841 [Medicago truncatula]